MIARRQVQLVTTMAALSGSLACEGVTDTAPEQEQVTESQAALSTGETQNTIRILVHPRVYAALTSALNTLAADMRAEGWTATVAQFTSNRAADLKDYLRRDYAETGGRLAGALFVGDLPWVKCIDSWHDHGASVIAGTWTSTATGTIRTKTAPSTISVPARALTTRCFHCRRCAGPRWR